MTRRRKWLFFLSLFCGFVLLGQLLAVILPPLNPALVSGGSSGGFGREDGGAGGRAEPPGGSGGLFAGLRERKDPGAEAGAEKALEAGAQRAVGEAAEDAAGDERIEGAGADFAPQAERPDAKTEEAGGWEGRLLRPYLKSQGLSHLPVKKTAPGFSLVLPKGKPVHDYALGLEKACAAAGVEVVDGLELPPEKGGVEYTLRHAGEQVQVRLSLGATFLSGAARLALVFYRLDSLGGSDWDLIRSTSFAKTLVLNPRDSALNLEEAGRLNSWDEVLAEQALEPSNYPYVNPGKHGLYIHQGAAEVARILESNLDRLPQARGFASRFGDRAVENLPLLERLFAFTLPRNLLFLDLTGSPRSLASQAAAAAEARCFSAVPDRADLSKSEEVRAGLEKKIVSAQKTGSALWVLPYRPALLQELERLSRERGPAWRDEGFELVRLSELKAPRQRAEGPPKTEARGGRSSG